MIKRYAPRALKRAAKSAYFRGLVMMNRLRGQYVVLFHLSLAGQAQYIAPILQKIKSRGVRMTVCLHIGDSIKRADIAHLKVPAGRIFKRLDSSVMSCVDAYVTPTQWAGEVPNCPWRICVFHGQPSKGNTFIPELVSRFNAFFLLGPLQRHLFEEFAETHQNIASHIKTFNVGYPKTDALLSGEYARENVLMSLGLDSSRPTVIYAPAYDPGTSLDLYGDEVIRVMLAMRPEINVLVKLHPMSYDKREFKQHTRGLDWTEYLRIFERAPCFRHLGNVPLDPYLAASDVMVTDISGAAFEFMMLDRPVIYVDCPQFFVKTCTGEGTYIHKGSDVIADICMNAGRSSGIVVPVPSDLPCAIRRSLDFPSEYSLQRKTVRAQLLYNPGNGAEEAVSELQRLVGSRMTKL